MRNIFRKRTGATALQTVLSVLAVVAVGVGAWFAFSKNKTAPQPEGITPSTNEPAANGSENAATSSASENTNGGTPNASGYTDGTYTATGNYLSPGGAESIGVTLTLKDGVVTSAAVQTMGRERESREMQKAFAGGFKTYVIGKSIATLSVDKVSGSSLTPKGFNDAVVKIRAQAQVQG